MMPREHLRMLAKASEAMEAQIATLILAKTTLLAAAEQFREYEKQHRAKVAAYAGDPTLIAAFIEKAKVNGEMARRMESAFDVVRACLDATA